MMCNNANSPRIVKLKKAVTLISAAAPFSMNVKGCCTEILQVKRSFAIVGVISLLVNIPHLA
jgi:hypothetical protein